jgi:hypothetical protein
MKESIEYVLRIAGMRVHWTNNAIEHLTNIYEYIGLNSPTYLCQRRFLARWQAR